MIEDNIGPLGWAKSCSDAGNLKHRNQWVMYWDVRPRKIPVSTRNITFAVGDPGDPYKPAFTT